MTPATTTIDPQTLAEPVEPSIVAREVVQTLVQQTVELHDLRSQLRALVEESRHDDRELRDEIERARDERRQLRRMLDDSRAEIAHLQLTGD